MAYENGIVRKSDSGILSFLKKNRRILVISLIIIVIAVVAFQAIPRLLNFGKKSGPVANLPKHWMNAFSAREDYHLLISNRPAIEEYLDGYKIWDRTYNASVQKDNLPLNQVYIFLVDDEKQQISYKDTTGKVVFSYSLIFDKDTLKIRIYLPDDILKSDKAARTFGSAIPHILSNISTNSDVKRPLLDNAETQSLFIIIKSK